MNRLRGVEAGRGMAAALVVLVHASDMLSSPKYFGTTAFWGAFQFAHAGVDFFFVLSGFIIYYVHRSDIGRPARVGNYAWRRFARIFPTYWAVMAGLGLILLYSPEKDPSVTSLGNVIASVLLLPRLQTPVLSVAWTLRHELIFYGLFALLLLNRTAGRIALTLWAGLILWNMAVAFGTGQPYFQGLAGDLFFRVFNIEFFFGMAVAILVDRGKFWRPRTVLVLGILLFFADGMLESFGPHVPAEWPPRHIGYALGAALTLYGLVGAERTGRLRVPQVLFIIGSASYSIYLTHVITIQILQQIILMLRRFMPLNLDVTFLIVWAISIAGGVIFWRLVERPLLQWLPRNPSWRSPRIPAPASPP